MEHTVWMLKTGKELEKAAAELVKYLGTCQGSASSHIREARRGVDFLTTRTASRGRATRLSSSRPTHPIAWRYYVEQKCPYCGSTSYGAEVDVFGGAVKRLHYSCNCLREKVFYVQFCPAGECVWVELPAKYRMFCVDLKDDPFYEMWKDYWLQDSPDQKSELADEIFRGRAEWANWRDNVRLVESEVFPRQTAAYVLFPTTDVGEEPSHRYSIGVTGGQLSYGYHYAGFNDYVGEALRLSYAKNNPLFECRVENYVLPEASAD